MDTDRTPVFAGKPVLCAEQDRFARRATNLRQWHQFRGRAGKFSHPELQQQLLDRKRRTRICHRSQNRDPRGLYILQCQQLCEQRAVWRSLWILRFGIHILCQPLPPDHKECPLVREVLFRYVCGSAFRREQQLHRTDDQFLPPSPVLKIPFARHPTHSQQ